MISNSQKKYVNSLKQKKFRTQNNSFIVEGVKIVEELLHSDYEVELIFATQNWIEKNSTINSIKVSEKELSQISSLKTPKPPSTILK